MLLNWVGNEHHQRYVLLVLVALERALYAIHLTPVDLLYHGGDSLWYAQQGWLILHNALRAPLYMVGPLYPLVLAAAWMIAPGAQYPTEPSAVPASVITLVAVLQVVCSILLVELGYRIARRLTASHPASMLAAIGVGLGPTFVMQPFLILTETLFMTLLLLALWLSLRAPDSASAMRFALAGLVFGLAALTRPILLLYPLGLALFLFLSLRHTARMACIGALLGGFFVMLLPWGIYMYRGTGTWIPEGFASNLWIGSVGSGSFQGAAATDALRQTLAGSQTGYADLAVKNISADPLGWILLRVRNTVAATLQPHGTDNFPDLKIKQLFSTWFRTDRTISGLLALTRIPDFWMRVAIYIFHYTSLTFGILGACLVLRDWRRFFIPYSIIAYFFLAYGALTVTPRYLFPTQMFFWLFAGIGLIAVWDRVRRRQTRAQGVDVPTPVTPGLTVK